MGRAAKGPTLAHQRPSFLKRQKEIQRLARADQKRQARADRKQRRAEGGADDDIVALEDLLGPMHTGEDDASGTEPGATD